MQLKLLDIVLSVCMDETNTAMGKYQYPESAKVHQVVCALARCCDVGARCQSAGAAEGAAPLPNPYAEPHGHGPRPLLSPAAADVLYNRTGSALTLALLCVCYL